jgi:threonine synthase
MSAFLGYRCSLCGREYSPDEEIYMCSVDGGNLDILLDYENIRRRLHPDDIHSRTEPSIWRYLPLLPIDDPACQQTPLRRVGNTPSYYLPTLAGKYGIKNLWVKDESLNPTASFKDRASAVVVAKARELHKEVIITASTGNAGAALAGMSAAVGQKSIILAPKTAPVAKIAQLLVYGAQVVLVDGNYDQAFDLSMQAAQEFGWYCRNTGVNPFTLEGKKTAALEIWEYLLPLLPSISKPLVIFVPVGDGNIISGIHKGFKDLQSLGWLEQIPRLIGVQSENSAAIVNAYETEKEIITPVHSTTIADSISVDLPRDGVRALRAVRETGGVYLSVRDDAIIAAIAELGRAGIFAEPAGAAAFAGLKKAVEDGTIDREDSVLVVNTGNGLKDILAAMLSVETPKVIEPTLTSLKQALNL